MDNYYQLKPSVITEEFEGELIAHDTDSGNTVLLQSDAQTILEYLNECRHTDYIINKLTMVQKKPQTAVEETVEELLESLLERGLVNPLSEKPRAASG